MPVSLIRRVETFVGLSDERKRGLRQAFRSRRAFARDADFYRQGDPTTGVTVMIGGLAYRYKELSSGRRQIVAYLLPGDVVSMGILSGDICDHGVRFLSASIVSSIHPLDLAALSPELVWAMWSLVSRELSVTWEWIANVGQRDSKARLAHLFCELYYRMLEIGEVHDGAIRFPVSQQELADSVGITIVHANRTLQALRRDGLITFDGRVLSVHNIQGLKTTCGFGGDYLHLHRSSAAPPFRT